MRTFQKSVARWARSAPSSNNAARDPCVDRLVKFIYKIIHAEYRLRVVEGTIVSASLYRRGGVTCYSNQVDERVWQFARERLAQWSPNRAFCLDVADTPNGLKVVEINAINSSAFYAGDIGRFVEAINRMEAGDLVRADGVNNPLGYRTVAPAGALQSQLLTRKPR